MKVVSFFHINQAIYFPTRFPKPHRKLKEDKSLHTLDVRRVLAFYLDQTKPFRDSPQ